jgi:hypothetical protein
MWCANRSNRSFTLMLGEVSQPIESRARAIERGAAKATTPKDEFGPPCSPQIGYSSNHGGSSREGTKELRGAVGLFTIENAAASARKIAPVQVPWR